MSLSAKVAAVGQLCEQGEFEFARRQAPDWDDLLGYMAEFRWKSHTQQDLETLVGIVCLRSFLDREYATPNFRTQDAILSRLNQHLIALEAPYANQLFGLVQLNRADRLRAEEEWIRAGKILDSLKPPMLTVGPKLTALISAVHGLMWLHGGYLQLAGNRFVPACKHILSNQSAFGPYIVTLSTTALLRLCWWDLAKVESIVGCRLDIKTAVDNELVKELTGLRHAELIGSRTVPNPPEDEVWSRYYLPAYRPLDAV